MISPRQRLERQPVPMWTGTSSSWTRLSLLRCVLLPSLAECPLHWDNGALDLCASLGVSSPGFQSVSVAIDQNKDKHFFILDLRLTSMPSIPVSFWFPLVYYIQLWTITYFLSKSCQHSQMCFHFHNLSCHSCINIYTSNKACSYLLTKKLSVTTGKEEKNK